MRRGGAAGGGPPAEAAAQAAQEQLPALAENTEALEAQRDEAKQDLADTIEYRKMLAENEKQLANVKAGVELKLKGRRTALNEADAAEQKLGRELDAARQRLGVLKELEKNMDGYQNSVKTVMRAASARRLRGIIGPVSSILEVEPGREVAIETALGGALQNIVVESEAAAKVGIALLRSENAGRATFLPLDTVQPGVFRGRLTGSAKLASSLVKADARYEMAYQRRLSRHKAQYSLDCDDGIEYSACLHEPTPQELLERMETFLRLWNALNSLPEIQGRRIDAHIILGKSIKEIAEAEGVHEESIRQSIKRGLERMKKTF